MHLRVIRTLFYVAALVALYLAFDQYEVAMEIDETLETQMPLLNAARLEMEQLSKAPAKPLLERDEALEELLVHLIDETDLLGGSVRLDVPDMGLEWRKVSFGVEKTSLAMSLSELEVRSLGFFHILWGLLDTQPVRITKADIKRNMEIVTLHVDLDLFALERQ